MGAEVIDTHRVRKARGAYFTPEPLARYIAEWAVRSTADRILEPSCGEAVFLLAAIERLRALRDPNQLEVQLATVDGVEIHAPSAEAARVLLKRSGIDSRIINADFFSIPPTPHYDAVIGNPPFVRYQDFSGEARARARAAALVGGVSLTRLASSWAAFTVHAALFLKPGGRLGLVLPAELLTVNYASEVRRFLMQRFRSVRLVLFTQRVFPDVQEEVVLLLADAYDPTGRTGTDHCELIEAYDADSLKDLRNARRWRPLTPEDKWTPSMLPANALRTFDRVMSGDAFTVLESWGDTTLGMVTGNNRYFALSDARVRELGLSECDVIRLSPPGSRHLRGLTYTMSAHREMADLGFPVWLFRPNGEPSLAGDKYISDGERTGVATAYKCRVRKPWWRVPLVPPADLFLTYMNADTPRFCANRARVHHLNSVHGVYLKSAVRKIGADLLPLAALNSLTLLAAETVGRAYGGGMLKLEPREADVLPVPSPDMLDVARRELAALRPQLATHLRAGKLMEAAKLVDGVVLNGAIGLSRAEVRALRSAHAELTARRQSRGRKSGRDGQR